jgi:prophage regulatory protein
VSGDFSTKENLMKILRLADVMSKTGLSKTSVYEYITAGNFPKQIKLGPRSAGWVEAEIDAWLASRIEASRGKGAQHESR